MRDKFIVSLLFFLLIACDQKRENNLSHTSKDNITTVDTIVGSKIIANEIAGSAYRNRAKAYFLIVGKETSDFTCVFTESKDGGKVWIDLNIPYAESSMTYRQRMVELGIILKQASKDFKFDSLTTIGFGRLILSGDLAIDVSNQYSEKFGASSKFADYKTVAKFLKESKLATDLDSIFKPYSISVQNVSIEKLFFADKSSLQWGSRIEADSAAIPDSILDCITWVKVKKQLPK